MIRKEELKLVTEWDKTFPKSDKVNHEKVTFVNRYGITLAADLYVPKSAEVHQRPCEFHRRKSQSDLRGSRG